MNAGKNVSSLFLLESVKDMIEENGYAISNIDATLVLQTPKIQSYIPTIRKNITSSLRIAEDSVSIKATTTEGLGFEGRGEGVSAQAVCLINKTQKH